MTQPQITTELFKAIIYILVSGFGGLCIVTGYFLRQQNNKIESFSGQLDTTKKEIIQDVKNNKKELVEMFNKICIERQDACGKRMDLKFKLADKEK